MENDHLLYAASIEGENEVAKIIVRVYRVLGGGHVLLDPITGVTEPLPQKVRPVAPVDQQTTKRKAPSTGLKEAACTSAALAEGPSPAKYQRTNFPDDALSDEELAALLLQLHTPGDFTNPGVNENAVSLDTDAGPSGSNTRNLLTLPAAADNSAAAACEAAPAAGLRRGPTRAAKLNRVDTRTLSGDNVLEDQLEAEMEVAIPKPNHFGAFMAAALCPELAIKLYSSQGSFDVSTDADVDFMAPVDAPAVAPTAAPVATEAAAASQESDAAAMEMDIDEAPFFAAAPSSVASAPSAATSDAGFAAGPSPAIVAALVAAMAAAPAPGAGMPAVMGSAAVAGVRRSRRLAGRRSA